MTSRPTNTPRLGIDSGPAGGWGSAKAVGEVVVREHIPLAGPSLLIHQNKPDGYMCVSCAWAKPAKTHPLEFCENGAKATAWEVTSRRADQAFFATHTLSELETWLDHDLEERGRLTHPMRWDAASDKYVQVSWGSAFREIGEELRRIAPQKVEFYTSGRASLEASYMYQLFARIFGSNKTVRGFLVMPLATGLSFLLVSMATAGRMSGLWPLQPLEYAALGLLAGAGFMAGELPNSFVKRQLGIAPGAPAQGMVLRPVCSLLDRLDSPLGALAALALVVPVPPLTILYVLAIGPFLHGAFSVATFRLGGKERAA